MPADVARLVQLAREFLARSDVACFLGYEEAPRGGTRPVILRPGDDAERLVWNRHCHASLVAYLPGLRQQEGLVGVAVKGCDARALRELIRSRQVDRQRLFVVGLPCTGLAGLDGEEVARRCHGCRYPEGFEYDESLGPMVSPALPAAPPADVDLAAMSHGERWVFWQEELERCIRCDACRRICYGCFCPECIFESSSPRWLPRREGPGEKLFFHAVRALHLAGRCTGCDECLRVCPTGVRLDLLNRSLREHLAELFEDPGAGVTDAPPPLTTFSMQDRDPTQP